jgi:signal transduction histidine kinase
MTQRMPAMRMRTLLLIPLLLIPVALTTACLLIVRRHMKQELQQGLADDLLHSSSTFRNLENNRRGMLAREAILLADQPSLKALMTTLDAPTIQNAGGEYAHLSGSDIFALASPSGNIIAMYEPGKSTNQIPTDTSLTDALRNPAQSHYALVNHTLYEMAAQPIYFGSRETGSVLGYVLVGAAIDRSLAQQVAQSVNGEVAFYSGRQLISGSLPPDGESALVHLLASGSNSSGMSSIDIAGEQYRLDRIQLSADSSIPVDLIVLKSTQSLQKGEMRLNHTMLTIGIIAFLVGGLLAVGVARSLTAPLEELAVGVRSIGAGDYDAKLPDSGALEVRGLSLAMDAMRRQIRKAQEDLVESERLATIGKMASSVSHDLRHYLASVYANAEFLAAQDLSMEDKMEFLGDIQLSVRGTTDLIDSLLLFSHTGRSLNKSYESVSYLAERAMALLRNHPETNGIEVRLSAENNCETHVDAKKVERVLYNLMLNACQSAQKSCCPKLVQVVARETGESIEVDVIDSGGGVAAEIRDSLFEPFISANKENGVGIGLTLASTIALEHGGMVRLEASAPGRTIFRLTLPRTVAASIPANAKPA